MSSVVYHGRVTWDRSQFPADEMDDRVRAVQAAMVERGLNGLIVAGTVFHYADLLYLTQYITGVWSLAIVPRDGQLTLISGMGGGRELPAARARTSVADVRNLRNLGPALEELLRERELSSPIGLVGIDALTPLVERRLQDGLASFTTVPADDVLGGMYRTLRPRELAAVERAAAILQAALAALQAAHARGAPNTAAIIEAERVARLSGALDVRCLVNQAAGESLQPIEEQLGIRTDPLLAYMAVNVSGYWADASTTIGAVSENLRSEAQSLLDAMRSAARAGALVRDIAAIVRNRAHDREDIQVRPESLGNGIGISLAMHPEVTLDSAAVLAPESVLSLRVRLMTGDDQTFLASDLVHVTHEAGRSLLRPPT